MDFIEKVGYIDKHDSCYDISKKDIELLGKKILKILEKQYPNDKFKIENNEEGLFIIVNNPDLYDKDEYFDFLWTMKKLNPEIRDNFIFCFDYPNNF